MIELDKKQCQTLRNGEPVYLTLPQIGEDIVLLRASKYEKMREKLEEQGENDTLIAGQMESNPEYQALLAAKAKLKQQR